MTMPDSIAKKRDELAEAFYKHWRNRSVMFRGDREMTCEGYKLGFDAAWELAATSVEEAKRQAREDEEASAVSFDWISTATDLKEIQEYARNCAYLIRTGTLPPEPKETP